MLDLAATALDAAEIRRLEHPATGGVILFSRNYESLCQLRNLIGRIRDVRPELLIAVDHEGGRVQRFRTEFTRLPPASAYRAIGAAASAAQAAETAGWVMAGELRSVDVDFSFAPVLDVDCGISQVIGDRAFSDRPGEATVLATAFFRGMQRAGMAGVGKHFPGHGAVAADSHLALPIDNRPWQEIHDRDLTTFQSLIAAGIEGIMPAHVVYPACDTQPAGFSRFWIGEVLRERLRFTGAVFSDDLSMVGAHAAGGLTSRALAAVEAGCDMVLVCNIAEDVEPVLDALGDSASPERQHRLRAMRGRFPVDRERLMASAEWRDAIAALTTLTETGVA
ncbi:MAG: beta-N-acetylhexosaminidase [Gammaproteobacteria bacterium]|nr:beta-N-acetylhexosaminidase [Gammaproteobacteria bacterium]